MVYIVHYNSISTLKPLSASNAAQPPSSYNFFRRSGHTLEDFSFTKFNKDDKVYSLSGSRLEIKGAKIGIFRFNPKKIAQIQNAQIIFFKNNKPVSKAISPLGVYEPLSGRVSLLKGVMFETVDRKRRLTSDSLIFNGNDNYILSENARVTNESGQITNAKSFRCDTELKDMAAGK